MPVLIEAMNNTAYGPIEVNKKYAPLTTINLTVTPKVSVNYFSELFAFRNSIFRVARLLPSPLVLMTPDWAAVNAAEATPNRLPPLLVISSNRAGWIRRGVDAAQSQLDAYKRAAFTNETDLRALTAMANQSASPPIYTPLRLGDAAAADPPPNTNRGVYVLVHSSEYRTYRDTLAGTGITAVGWDFDSNSPLDLALVGFGAARFAAIEFAKWMWRNGKQAWSKGWLLDDGVVRLTNFPGFITVEQALAANACVGFKGGTKAFPQSHIRDKAREALEQGYRVDLTPTTPDIVQQASLWNIDFLERNRLNFGPAFITSAEDLSMTNYLKANNFPFLYYGGMTVMKEEATNDNDDGTKNYQALRDQLQKWVVGAEGTIGPARSDGLPPPIQVNGTSANDPAAPVLAAFVADRVIPESLFEDKGPAQTLLAQCQAVEQINCKALTVMNRQGKLALLNENAVNSVFKINGQAAQQINAIDV